MTNARFALAALLLLAPSLSNAQQPAKSAAKPAAEDARLRTIYTAEDAWRKAQRGAGDPDHPHRIPSELPFVNDTQQQSNLAHWQAVLRQVDALHPAALSPDERVNFQVFRAQIVSLINQQKFREYERPVNSDSTFWSDEEDISTATPTTLEDYQNYVSQLHDLPRYFRENIANMKAGLARNFTAPKVTLAGRDQSLLAVAEAKTPQATVYYKPFEKMSATISPADQTRLRAAAADAIQTDVIPVYRDLLTFFRDTYIPHAQPSLAAEDLPDGKDYYQSKIVEFTTLTLTPAQIHEIGLREMEKIHAEMLATMQQANFKGDLHGG